jgi:hypothetical protein
VSRTIRNKRPRMRLGTLSDHIVSNGKVRDGTPQHVSGSCENHGGCPYCEANRLFGNKKREPIPDPPTSQD